MALAARHLTERTSRKWALAAWLSFAAFLAASQAIRRFCAEAALLWDKL